MAQLELHMTCDACDQFHFRSESQAHRSAVCVANRPICHIPGCERLTCVQARYHGYIPTCLDHFFTRGAEKRIPKEHFP